MDSSYPPGDWASSTGLKVAGFVAGLAVLLILWFPQNWYEWVIPGIALIFLASRFPHSPAGSAIGGFAGAFAWVPPIVLILHSVGVVH